jgi:hypothetical protein
MATGLLNTTSVIPKPNLTADRTMSSAAQANYEAQLRAKALAPATLATAIKTAAAPVVKPVVAAPVVKPPVVAPIVKPVVAPPASASKPAATPGLTTSNTTTSANGQTVTGSSLINGDPTYNASLLSDPTKWNVDKSQTVSGQLETDLKSGSPLMQLAKTQGLQSAADRGLLNSSMAVGAAQTAMIDRAMPMAQQDATTNSQAAGWNAGQSNEFAKTNQATINAAAQYNKTAQLTVAQANQNVKNAMAQYNVSNNVTIAQKKIDIEAAKNLAVLNGNIQASLKTLESNQALTQQTQQLVASLTSEYAKGQQAINQDPNMNQETKNAASLQNYNNFKASLDLIAAVGKIPNVGALLKPTGIALAAENKSPTNPQNLPPGHAYDEGRNDPNYLTNRQILINGIKKYKPNFLARTDTMSNSEITTMLTTANYQ